MDNWPRWHVLTRHPTRATAHAPVKPPQTGTRSGVRVGHAGASGVSLHGSKSGADVIMYLFHKARLIGWVGLECLVTVTIVVIVVIPSAHGGSNNTTAHQSTVSCCGGGGGCMYACVCVHSIKMTPTCRFSIFHAAAPPKRSQVLCFHNTSPLLLCMGTRLSQLSLTAKNLWQLTTKRLSSTPSAQAQQYHTNTAAAQAQQQHTNTTAAQAQQQRISAYQSSSSPPSLAAAAFSGPSGTMSAIASIMLLPARWG